MLRVVTHRDQRNKEIMGCDIHFFTERFTSSNDYEGPRDLLVDRSNRIDEIVDGKPSIERWVSADAWDIDDGDWLCVERYDGRNYYLFSILADVRNSGEEVIDYPRGIPLDASCGYLHKCDSWSSDAHSHSYFTLRELLDVDWGKYDSEYLEEFLTILEELKSIDSDFNKVRVCFFFDN